MDFTTRLYTLVALLAMTLGQAWGKDYLYDNKWKGTGSAKDAAYMLRVEDGKMPAAFALSVLGG